MSDNPKMVTNAKRLHNRFLVHLALYAEGVAEAKASYARTRTFRSKRMFEVNRQAFEVNRQAMVAIIKCYSDATNMTFKQAQAALGVSDAVFKELS